MGSSWVTIGKLPVVQNPQCFLTSMCSLIPGFLLPVQPHCLYHPGAYENHKTPKEENNWLTGDNTIVPCPVQEHTDSLHCARTKQTNKLKAGHEDTLACNYTRHLTGALQQCKCLHCPEKQPWSQQSHLGRSEQGVGCRQWGWSASTAPWCRQQHPGPAPAQAWSPSAREPIKQRTQLMRTVNSKYWPQSCHFNHTCFNYQVPITI